MEKLLNAMPLLTSIMLGLIFALGLTWQGLDLRDTLSVNEGDAQQQARERSPDRAPAQTVDLEKLTFFGEPGDDAGPRVTETEDLPETNLQLVLRGVMAGDRERRDSALVEGPDGETDVYRVSESLPGDAVLKKVHRKRIVIERGGALETLSFPENLGDGSLSMASSNTGSSNTRQSASTPEPVNTSDSGNTPEPGNEGSASGNNSQEEVRARLNKLRERLSDDR